MDRNQMAIQARKTKPDMCAAIFDLGNVVIKVDLSAVPRRLAEITGLSGEKVAEALLDGGRRDLLEVGRLSMEEYYRQVIASLGRPISYEEFDRAWNTIYCGVCNGIEEMLVGLRKTIRMVALTNTNAGHADWWTREYAGVVGKFEKVFMSYEMGVAKPQPECFQRVIDYLSLKPAEVVFVDDSPANVQAAVAMGMKGIIARSTSQISRELAAMGVEIIRDSHRLFRSSAGSRPRQRTNKR
jgi:HAD superfamily hydrolase (TIGR01509 family)